MKQDKVQKIYRLPPCPAYDVAGTEGWLEEMARRGWFLAKDGFFAGVAAFERGEPRPVRYRLTGALKSTSMWSDDGGCPDPEEITLGKKYAWEYMGNRGEFTVYRTFDPDARELNTDPEVQAEAVKAVKNRRSGTVTTSILWLAVYPLLYFFHGGFFLETITLHSWYFLLTVLIVLLLCGGSLWEVFRLGKLQKKLQYGEVLTPDCPSEAQARRFWGRKAAVCLLVIIWVCVTLSRWSADILEEDKTALAWYGQTPPFATLETLAGAGASDYRSTMTSGRTDIRYNYFQSWSDWLAPRNIKWVEHARVTRADGTELDGGLYVDYHETAAPWIAAGLARDYVRYDRGRDRRSYTPLDLPALDADFAQAYTAIFPTVVFQKGNIVVHASFFQTGEGPKMTLDEWAAILEKSIQ